MAHRRILLSAVMASLAIIAMPGLLSAGEQVPFKGNLEGTYTATPVDPNVPLVVAVQLDAHGQAAHLGAYVLSFPHIVDRSQRPSVGIGSCVITAANGDQVFADIVGQATLIGPGLLDGTEQAVITGGTGRFVGSTGAFTIRRLINQQSLTTIGEFAGTISSPGSSAR